MSQKEKSSSKRNPDVVGTLCAAAYSRLGTQEATNGMYVVQRGGMK